MADDDDPIWKEGLLWYTVVCVILFCRKTKAARKQRRTGRCSLNAEHVYNDNEDSFTRIGRSTRLLAIGRVSSGLVCSTYGQVQGGGGGVWGGVGRTHDFKGERLEVVG